LLGPIPIPPELEDHPLSAVHKTACSV
jgi:hypothetical protein